MSTVVRQLLSIAVSLSENSVRQRVNLGQATITNFVVNLNTDQGQQTLRDVRMGLKPRPDIFVQKGNREYDPDLAPGPDA